MTVRDDRSNAKQTTAGFRGPLMVQSRTASISFIRIIFIFLFSLLCLSGCGGGGAGQDDPDDEWGGMWAKGGLIRRPYAKGGIVSVMPTKFNKY